VRIGLYLDNEGHKNVNINSIGLGNPGIGGSEYWAYMLAYYLTDYYKEIEFIFFTTSKLNLLKQNISNVIVSNVLLGIQEAKYYKVDILIINKHANVNTCDLVDLCKLIDEIKLPTITFGQNYYSQKECDLIAKCKFIKRNIFVSRQQYCIYSDLDIINKSSYIYNFIKINNFNIRTFPSEMIVTYIGSLVGTKGFHILARNWKNILRECPNAKLKVIGNGKLYSRNSKLGNYNIADQDYENKFIPYLLDGSGNILRSIEFLGLLSGKDIFDVVNNTTVGVVNPSGLSETFCISAIELESMGVPVVSKKYGGLLDTIKDKETGLLFANEKDLSSMIVRLLIDKKLNDEYSKNAYRFVRETFSSEIIIPIWYKLFQEIINNKTIDSVEPIYIRKIKKLSYTIHVNRPPLNKLESLHMPFNNYKKYSKPEERENLLSRIRNKLQLKSKLRNIYRIFRIKINGLKAIVNAPNTIPYIFKKYSIKTNLKVFIYDLPTEYQSRPNELLLPSKTFYGIYDYFKNSIATKDPTEADYFFVPLNLIQSQFKNEDPKDIISELKYLSTKKDHILVATGDFSQRSKKNHFGHAYEITYDWLDKFILLALESTNDLIPNQDIGIIPFNTLVNNPYFNTNKRMYLYSFLGRIKHELLPENHVRNQLVYLTNKSDVLINTELDCTTKKKLEKNYGYAAKDDFELLARNSTFTLAPAGYGKWTYRFFNAIQWGSIPVLFSDDYIKPFSNIIPYNSFSITLHEKDILNVDKTLRTISSREIEQYKENLKANQSKFTRRAFFEMLVRELETLRQ